MSGDAEAPKEGPGKSGIDDGRSPTHKGSPDLIKVTLKLNKKEWEKILTGLPFDKKGQGFMSEAGSHNDLWRFNLDCPGSLEVDYSSAGDADDGFDGQGFIGSFEGASIEVEPYQDRSSLNRRRRGRG
jgi:hypothetical protein